VGVNSGTIETSYATGDVTGDSEVGGLVGVNQQGGTIETSYWDTNTTGWANACGVNSGTCSATGLTTAQARTQAAYDDFDFDKDWVMFDGTRPFLRAEWSTSIANAHQLQLMALD